MDNWSKILDNFEMDPATKLRIIQPDDNATVAEILINETQNGEYGSLIIGRCGGTYPCSAKDFWIRFRATAA